MHLSHLRRRFLIAMGLPALGTTWAACASPPPPDDPTDPALGQTGTLQIAAVSTTTPTASTASENPTTAMTSRTTEEVVQVAADGTCGNDRIRETICGRIAPVGEADPCCDDGANLTSYGASQIHVTKYFGVSHDQAFKGWHFAQDATDSYRGTVGGTPETKRAYCCYENCTSLHAGDKGDTTIPPDHVPATRCIPTPSGTDHPAPGASACPAAIEQDGQMRAYTSTTGGRCCYLVPARRPPQVMHPRGRPLRVEGTAALPGTVAREDWQSAGPIPLAAPPLPPETRTALAAAWREEARMEHASIAAFAKLSLELLALGAPPDLLAGAHQAAIEEVAHAQMAFALASSYAAEPVGPSPLQQATSVGQEPITFARLVEETLMDGCAGETAAAVEAACAAETATDPSVIAALRTIADDESRHAELAFRILAWALRTSPEESAPAVERTLARLRTEAHAAPDTPARPTETGLLGDDRGPLAPLRTEAHAALDTPARPTETGLLGDDRGPLARHGVLGSGERARIRRQVLCEVVIPAIESAALRVSSSACTSPTCAAAS